MSQIENYWKVQREHSRIKSEIVAAYFIPWAEIIGRYCKNLYYLDLFSGKGRYDCGSPSTPLMIMDELSKRPDLAKRTRLAFYEEKHDWLANLETEIKAHPAYINLPREPFFKQQDIDVKFVATLSTCITKGTYSFIDPWGYSEVTLDLLDVVTRDWGCDCMFYLSISGLVRNLGQEEKWPKIERFFGRDSFRTLMTSVNEMNEADDLSDVIFSTIKEALKSRRGYFFLKYVVEFDEAKCPSHYLVFLTKDKLGFGIMRDIMLKRGIPDQHGIPSMVFSPVRKRESDQLSLELVTAGDNLGKLCADVISDFSGQTILVGELMERCLEASYPFRDAHIRKALVELREQKKLEVVYAPSKRIATIIGNKAIVHIL